MVVTMAGLLVSQSACQMAAPSVDCWVVQKVGMTVAQMAAVRVVQRAGS